MNTTIHNLSLFYLRTSQSKTQAPVNHSQMKHSEPARAAAAFRHSGQADQRIFCIGGLIAHNKKRLLHFRLKRCTTASFAIRAGVPVPAPHSAPSNRRPCGYSRTPCGTRYPPAQGSAAGRAPSGHAKSGLRPNPLKLDGVDSDNVEILGNRLAAINRNAPDGG